MFVKRMQGNGPPLLMLHGWGQTHEALKSLADLLVPVVSPHIVDLPGFGRSPVPDAVWSAYDYAERLMQYADDSGLKTFAVLGHSFGGKVAMCLAIRYPERIKRLALLAPSGVPARKTLKKCLRMWAIKATATAVKQADACCKTDYFQAYFVPRFASKDYQNAGPMRPILVRSVREDLSPALPSIRCPSLLLWGEQDTETPLEAGRRIARLIPRAALHVFPQHGHFLFQECGAHLCATYLRPFLKGEAC